MFYDNFNINHPEIVESKRNKSSYFWYIAALIHANLMGEHDAMKGYYQLLTYLTDEADVKVIKEIIADEKNHAEKLQALELKLTKLQPTKS